MYIYVCPCLWLLKKTKLLVEHAGKVYIRMCIRNIDFLNLNIVSVFACMCVHVHACLCVCALACACVCACVCVFMHTVSIIYYAILIRAYYSYICIYVGT